MSATPGPIRTPRPPVCYELVLPGMTTVNGIAANCPHCDWTQVKPYPRTMRPSSQQAQELADQLAQQCTQHQREHFAAYVHGALKTAGGPLGDLSTAVKRLRDYGLIIIIADPDWTPKTEQAEAPADTAKPAA